MRWSDFDRAAAVRLAWRVLSILLRVAYATACFAIVLYWFDGLKVPHDHHRLERGLLSVLLMLSLTFPLGMTCAYGAVLAGSVLGWMGLDPSALAERMPGDELMWGLWMDLLFFIVLALIGYAQWFKLLPWGSAKVRRYWRARRARLDPEVS